MALVKIYKEVFEEIRGLLALRRLALPYKPKRPCSHTGCPELVNGRYCPAHAAQAHREYDKYRRRPESRKIYGHRWRIIRNLYIAKHPLCERCLEIERYTPAQEVHHIVPVADGGTHAEENLKALCKSCHSGMTLAEINRN